MSKLRKVSSGKKEMLAHTTIISVLVKADKHANDFQMFLSVLQESRKTGGRTKGSRGLENGKQASTKQNRQTLKPIKYTLKCLEGEDFFFLLKTGFKRIIFWTLFHVRIHLSKSVYSPAAWPQ